MPERKRGQFRCERDKFGAAGLTPVPAGVVRPPRIAECPIQIEAMARALREADQRSFTVVEVQAVAVHAHERIVADAGHIDPRRWTP